MGIGRNHGLDGLRGLAALFVIFYHSILVDAHLVNVMLGKAQTLTGHDLFAKIVLACVSGANAVLLFFVLSGFVLTLSFNKMEGSFPVVVYNFIVRRLCRLYPAMFFAMAIVFVVSNIEFSLGHANFERGATMSFVVQNALLWNISVHGASWTIQAELIAMPFLLVALTLTALSGVLGAFLCFVYAVFAMRHPDLVGNVPWMPQFLAAFMAGVVVANASLKPMFSALARQSVVIGAVLGLICVKLFFEVNGWAVDIVAVILCAMLVGGVYHENASMPFVRVLNSKPVQFLGRISYSLYLVNVPIIWVFIYLSAPLGLDHLGALERGLITGLLVTACSLPIAAFSERIFERAGIRLGRAISLRPVVRTADLAPGE